MADLSLLEQMRDGKRYDLCPRCVFSNAVSILEAVSEETLRCPTCGIEYQAPPLATKDSKNTTSYRISRIDKDGGIVTFTSKPS